MSPVINLYVCEGYTGLFAKHEDGSWSRLHTSLWDVPPKGKPESTSAVWCERQVETGYLSRAICEKTLIRALVLPE